MSENKAFKNALIKLGIACICATLYCWGGYGFLPARRFIMPAVLCGGMFYFSRDWRSLIPLPFLFGSLSLGYGKELVWLKIIKRGIFGLANGITSSGYNILRNNWLLVGTQIVLLVGLYVVIGVYNPFPSARIEELFLGLMITLIPLFSCPEK